MHRREWMSQFGLAVGGAGLGMPETYARATRGLPPLKITNVKAILTNPPYANGSFSFMQRLVIAKVETSEPGLYGLGCASFVFRPAAVADVICTSYPLLKFLAVITPSTMVTVPTFVPLAFTSMVCLPVETV